MEQQRLRRIPLAATEPTDIWLRVTGDSEWIYLDTLFGHRAISRSVWTPRLLRWGGLCGIWGGLLWMLLILLPHLGYVVGFYIPVSVRLENGLIRQTRTFLHDIPYYFNSNLVAVPLLLFIVAVIGLYAQQWRASSRLARVGLTTSIVGLLFTFLSVLNPNWLAIVHKYFAYGDSYLYSFSGWHLSAPIEEWIGDLWPGLIISAVGLVLLGVAMIRAKVLATGEMLFFIFSAVGMFTVPVVLAFITALVFAVLDFYYYEIEIMKLFSALDSLTFMALLFGIGWIRLGYKLRSKSTTHSAHLVAAGANA